ncbi:hypothetical protein BDF20DRAFT_147541 [Mycotypha africana]|uniref:uncharacterized protein n=1 Tax=Mycotypha africana TaxID=64632 RepID=UPI002301ADF2|nr:uncharacterized protein BDF20DRAFT_147541 [Mycotypha africana]KAI8969156.1 hypothetical protein BDF20DRAFT_147541 [Mycotypha africana]
MQKEDSSISDNSELENTKLLTEIKDNEQKITNSLREQLQKARKDKAALEADLEFRTKAYETNLEQLQRMSNKENTAQLQGNINANDINELRQQIKAFHDKCVEQENKIKSLEFELEMEQGHVKILKHDNKLLRQMTVDMNAQAEQEEEFISNRLLKRINSLKKEKGELLLQVEQEEEYMTNMLQKKLNQLQREKIDMENSLEQEQEYIVNKLQKQLETMKMQQGASSHTTSPMMTTVHDATSINTSNPVSPLISKKWGSSTGSVVETPQSAGTAEMLISEIAILKSRTTEMEKEFLLKMQQCNKYKSELVQFRKQAGLPVDDIPLDEGIPSVFRTVPPSPGRGGSRIHRSTSTSSQRSITSDKSNINNIPPFQLDSTHSDVSNTSVNRSRSNSSASTTVSSKSTRRVSGTLLTLAASGPSSNNFGSLNN